MGGKGGGKKVDEVEGVRMVEEEGGKRKWEEGRDKGRRRRREEKWDRGRGNRKGGRAYCIMSYCLQSRAKFWYGLVWYGIMFPSKKCLCGGGGWVGGWVV